MCPERCTLSFGAQVGEECRVALAEWSGLRRKTEDKGDAPPSSAHAGGPAREAARARGA